MVGTGVGGIGAGAGRVSPMRGRPGAGLRSPTRGAAPSASGCGGPSIAATGVAWPSATAASSKLLASPEVSVAETSPEPAPPPTSGSGSRGASRGDSGPGAPPVADPMREAPVSVGGAEGAGAEATSPGSPGPGAPDPFGAPFGTACSAVRDFEAEERRLRRLREDGARDGPLPAAPEGCASERSSAAGFTGLA
jgi:hypothetical protein